MTQLFVPVENLPEGFTYDSGSPYPAPEQHGPLRRFDREMRCASRGCGSSTFFKLFHIPTCLTHSIYKMNKMLFDLGVDV